MNKFFVFMAVIALAVSISPTLVYADGKTLQEQEKSPPSPTRVQEEQTQTSTEQAQPPGSVNQKTDKAKVLGQNSQKKDPQDYVDESLELLMPLDENDIMKYRSRATKRSKALSPVAPTLGTRTVLVQLQPGSVPQTVKTTANVATSLVFHDSTGQPWPIASVTNGGSPFYQIFRPETPERNLLNIVPRADNSSASLVVSLQGKDIPLVIRLLSDNIQDVKRVADGMVLFQIKSFGPNAAQPIVRNIRDTVSSEMISILDQVKPEKARKLKFQPQISGYALYALNGRYYLRTSDQLQWPASMGVVNGAGGIKCYELPITPTILISHQGEIIKLKIADEGR